MTTNDTLFEKAFDLFRGGQRSLLVAKKLRIAPQKARWLYHLYLEQENEERRKKIMELLHVLGKRQEQLSWPDIKEWEDGDHDEVRRRLVFIMNLIPEADSFLFIHPNGKTICHIRFEYDEDGGD